MNYRASLTPLEQTVGNSPSEQGVLTSCTVTPLCLSLVLCCRELDLSLKALFGWWQADPWALWARLNGKMDVCESAISGPKDWSSPEIMCYLFLQRKQCWSVSEKLSMGRIAMVLSPGIKHLYMWKLFLFLGWCWTCFYRSDSYKCHKHGDLCTISV